MPKTTAGNDWQASALGDRSGSRAAVADYIALSADTGTAVTTALTSLPGEIATAGGGLLRAAAVYGHTTGQNTYTLTKPFTANASDALPVTLKKAAVFNAGSGGLMPFIDNITDATLSSVGDQITLTVTVTM